MDALGCSVKGHHGHLAEAEISALSASQRAGDLAFGEGLVAGVQGFELAAADGRATPFSVTIRRQHMMNPAQTS